MYIEIIVASITVLLFLGTIISVWVNLNARITIVEQQIKNLDDKYEDLLGMIKADNEEVKSKLNKIDLKLDDFLIIKTEHNLMKHNCLNYDKDKKK